MQVIFLGTGSPRELDRANAAIAVRLAEHGRKAVDGPHEEADGGAAETVLLDTAGGNEILRQLRAARIAPETIHHILISHQHFDHAAGLAILLLDLSRFPGEPIFVYVPAAGLEAIRTVIEVQCPGVISTRLGERLRFVPLDPGQSAQLALSDGSAARDGHAGPVTSDGAERRAGEHTAILTATDAVHPVPAIGCVLEWRGRRLGYTGDTAPHPRLATDYARVDLLIHEASAREGPGAEAAHRIGHSTAADAGRAADIAGAKHLVLTHFPPQSAEERQAVLAEAAAYFRGPISLATDLAVLHLGPVAATEVAAPTRTIGER